MKRLLFIGLMTGLSLTLFAQVNYSITYNDSSSYKIRISIAPAKAKTGGLNFIMPRSVPGAYSMLNYDYFIEDLVAIGSSGEKLAMVKDPLDAPRWSCADTTKPISRVEYAIDLRKMESRLTPSDASIIRPGFASILNYSILGWIEGTEQEPVQCTVKTFSGWPVFSTNVPTVQPAKQTLRFNTVNYYELADGQLYLGPNFRVKEFKGLVPLYIVAYCQTGDEYLDDYGKQGMRSMEILKDYFGDIPFPSYSILLRKALPLEPGSVPPFGMEHLQSSTFFGDTSEFRSGPMSEQEVVATMPTYLHHMGHSYIPLRCYGDNYRPYVKEIPPIISNIWFNEGFMWFLPYEAIGSERWRKTFYENTYNTAPEIKAMTLSQLSQAASLMYANDFRLGKAVYSRGASMAIEMNSYIKEKTGGKRSMKDVLRYLYNWMKENKRPFRMDEFLGLINKGAGVDLGEIYRKWEGVVR